MRAIVRNTTKAEEVLPVEDERLELVLGDLSKEADLDKACEGVDAGAIWCATGFSDAGSFWQKIRGLWGVVVQPKKSVDIAGIGGLTRALQQQAPPSNSARFVMLSSAGVTRPSWGDAKKEEFAGAADIPIVRLNPFNILNKKCDAEAALRASGMPYSIVRPCGLNDDWPEGRPVLSQGDLAVGRCNRRDVAGTLVQALRCTEATGKTFEMLSLTGYPKPRSLSTAFSRLVPDADGPVDPKVAAAQYALLQQLLPGEIQDPTVLEMGVKYEEVDSGAVAAREKGSPATAREQGVAASVQG